MTHRTPRAGPVTAIGEEGTGKPILARPVPAGQRRECVERDVRHSLMDQLAAHPAQRTQSGQAQGPVLRGSIPQDLEARRA